MIKKYYRTDFLLLIKFDCHASLCSARNDDLNYSEVYKKTLKEIENLVEKIIENKKEGYDTKNEERE